MRPVLEPDVPFEPEARLRQDALRRDVGGARQGDERRGLEPIEAVGRQFDPELVEAFIEHAGRTG